ncbi:MAG: hypothetical protein U9N35_06030 [Euryarchaeota archaeon]|nr:hypothetical protein [Euryarchaeota archaeon]
MKKIVTVIVILSLCAVGCIGDGEETTEPSSSSTTAPTTPASEQSLAEVLTPKYTDKMWARHTVISGNQRTNLLVKMFEEVDMDIFETEMSGQGEKTVIQAWYAKSGETPLQGGLMKYVLKMGDTVYCKESTTPFFPPRPEEYASRTILRETTYTTPTGKSVVAFVVTDGIKEYWFSSEVPFSLVKIRAQGEDILILDDFGFDAEKEISREEIEHCRPMETPLETVSP